MCKFFGSIIKWLSRKDQQRNRLNLKVIT